METRSKAQRETVGADAGGLGSMTGEAVVRLARDPSPPVLSPVGFRATPVLAAKSQDDAEQHQEHADLRHGPEISTLESPVRIDPGESVMVRPTASGPSVSLSKQCSLSEYSSVVNVSLPAAASAVSTDSWDSGPKGDADEEVANFMTVNSPVAFRPPPSRASRRSVSRQSVHSVPGDPLVELMSRMVENAQQENLRREQEALRREQEMEKREQEAREETRRREQEAREEAREEARRREQAFELREKEIRRQNEQRGYDLRHHADPN